MTAGEHHFDGGCTCGAVRYRLTARPMFVHCCHCRYCQRETGSAFVINALIENDHVQILQGSVEVIDTPTQSGKGQRIARCPVCRIALWSHYGVVSKAVSFVRVGTLDDPTRIPPDIHIVTASKQPWVILPPDVPAVSRFYSMADYWPEESIRRRNTATRKKVAR